MESEALTFFQRILEIPSPSGYETPLQKEVRAYVAPFADEVRTDVHGNVVAVKNADAPLRVMLAGHCDQIGLIVGHVDNEGFLYVQAIGGWDPQILIGQKMNIWTAGGPIFGVIARKPIHLLTEEEAKKVVKVEQDDEKPGGGVASFLPEVVSEVRKVIWPTARQMVIYTLVVFAFLIIVTALVSGVDFLVGAGVEEVLTP